MQDNSHLLLNYQPDKASGVYGTNLNISGKEINLRFQYEMQVQYAGAIHQDSFAFRISRKDVFINGGMPDEHIDRLADACGKVFYPMTLITDEKGRYIKVRDDDIRQRWAEQRNRLRQQFIGEGAERYITRVDKKMSQPYIVSAVVEKDLFMKLFYGLTYGKGIDTEEKRAMELPVVPSGLAIRFLYGQSFEVNDRRIIIRQKGIVDDERSLGQLLGRTDLSVPPDKEDKKITGSCEIYYTLSKEEHTILSIEADFKLAHEEEEEIASVRFTSYYLEEKPVSPVHDSFVEQLKEKPSTSFFSWKHLFGI